MKVLVTGANGMLGRDVVAAADAEHHEVAAFARDELDVTNAGAVKRVFERELPRVVVNCAAYTAVDDAQSNETEATRVNGEAAGIIAAAAAEVNAKVFYPSSDYVFDGLKGEPYVESDETNPVGAYGRSKLAGEIATAEANPRHAIIRTSWLYGLHGRNFVETMLTLAQRQNEVLVVRDQIGCPTYTRQLADAMVHLFDYETLGVMHMAGADHCAWYDFAVEIFRQSQLDVKVLSATTDMLDRPAPRPPFSALVTEREDIPVLPRWDHGLHAYLVTRAERTTAEHAALPDDPGETLDAQEANQS